MTREQLLEKVKNIGESEFNNSSYKPSLQELQIFLKVSGKQ